MYQLDGIVSEWGHALGPVTFTIRPVVKGAETVWAPSSSLSAESDPVLERAGMLGLPSFTQAKESKCSVYKKASFKALSFQRCSLLCVFVCACTHAVCSVMSDSAISWAVARQAPLSMGFSRQECWSGLPFPTPGDLPDPGMEVASLAVAGGFSTTEPRGNCQIKVFKI